MFGKIFESLYTGSMRGAGSVVFAVWGYVIANQKPDKVVGAQVELNPEILAFLIGEREEKIIEAIAYLCAPDAKSNSKEEDGRRLIKIGSRSYRVVNGPKYLALRNEEERREYNRGAQVISRARKYWRGRGLPLAGETEWVDAMASGASQEALDAILEKYSNPTKETP
jgi:hypothetical protein